MNTLLNILFGFFILMFSGVAITLVGGWLVLQLFGNKEKDDCGCNSCDCDDDDLIPMLDRPLTKEELKEVNMKPKINDFSKKTKITGMGGHQMKNSDRFKNMKPREENDPNPNQK